MFISDRPIFRNRPFQAGIVLLVVLATATTARAHVEGAELAADVVFDRTGARMELRIAVRELINAEQPIDSVVLPDYTQDPMEVAKRNEELVLHGFHIRYEGKELAPKLVKTDVQNLVIGVNEEDIVPRQCAVYTVEFSGAETSPPSRIDIATTIFALPLDAGFQPTVMCLVTYQVAGTDMTRPYVIGLDETLTVKPQWNSAPVPAPGAVPAASPAAVAQASPAAGSKAGPTPGAMIVLGLGAAIVVGLLYVLARSRA